jgi:citrate synthase
LQYLPGGAQEPQVTDWIGAAEAAERLGIKPSSLYAYVSRGVLARRRDSDGRASLFDADEVAQLARKGRPRRSSGGPAELVIESELTEITGDQLRYRGRDAITLARERSLEEVAALLWTGSLSGPLPASGWQATPAAVAVGSAAQAALPPGTLPLERLQVIVPALAATDQLRLHLDSAVVIAAGQSIIAGMIACLPEPVDTGPASAGSWVSGAGPAAGPSPAVGADLRQGRATAGGRGRPGGSLAARLAPKLCTGQVPAGLTAMTQAAMVLLADHELAASTLAARVAASMRADPYAAVAAGLGALGGALHGGAALAAEMMLGSAADPADAPRVVGELLRRGERLPGFGHFVYKDGDPRAVLLLSMIRKHAPGSPRLAVAQAITAEARRRALPEPNIDFALAALTSVAGMIQGAGEAIFAIARTVGWLAHAMEEYQRNIPIRPRGVYTGPMPES